VAPGVYLPDCKKPVITIKKMNKKIYIYSSIDLKEDQLDSIKQKLSKIVEEEAVEYEVIVDSKLIGGIRIQIGSGIIDLSMDSNLEKMKNNLILN
jgi:F-type H+-transporting ATPase subunit delta